MPDTFAINACFVRHGRVGGAEQAAVNLVEGLRGQVRRDERWLVYDREPLVTRAPIRPLTQRTLPSLPRVNRMAYEPLALSMVRRPSAWLHLNYATPAGLRGPAVTVIHDAQYAHFPENFTAVKRRWQARAHARTVAHATVTIAISEFTARDLVRLHGRDVASRIVVLPDPVSFERLEPPAQPTQVPGVSGSDRSSSRSPRRTATRTSRRSSRRTSRCAHGTTSIWSSSDRHLTSWSDAHPRWTKCPVGPV